MEKVGAYISRKYFTEASPVCESSCEKLGRKSKREELKEEGKIKRGKRNHDG